MEECDFVSKVCQVVCPDEKGVQLEKVYNLIAEKYRINIDADIERIDKVINGANSFTREFYDSWCRIRDTLSAIRVGRPK